MFRIVGDARDFDTIDAALEAAEIENINCIVVDRYSDVVARRWNNGRLEFPVGAFSSDESAALASLRHKVG